jgi:hypothetical protein
MAGYNPQRDGPSVADLLFGLNNLNAWLTSVAALPALEKHSGHTEFPKYRGGAVGVFLLA